MTKINHKKKVSIHNKLVDKIANKLRNKGLEVKTNYLYEHGELDILTFNKGYFHYYEIKTTHTQNAWKRAIHQFDRFLDNYPLNSKCIYVAEKKGKLIVRRYYGKG